MIQRDQQLFDEAKGVTAADGSVSACWQIVLRAVELGVLDRAALTRALHAVESGQDFATDEVMFEFLDDSLRVSFVTTKHECAPSPFCALLRQLLGDVHPGTITYMMDDQVVSVRDVNELPESSRFANTREGKVPVVKVVALTMSDKMREVIEYGPNNNRLRSTIQMKK